MLQRLDGRSTRCHYICTFGDVLHFRDHLGVSSIMGSINIIATVMNMRAPGMTYMNAAVRVDMVDYRFLSLRASLAGAVTMMLMDIHFGTAFSRLPVVVTLSCSSTFSGSLACRGVHHYLAGIWHFADYSCVLS